MIRVCRRMRVYYIFVKMLETALFKNVKRAYGIPQALTS
jgi:hypothetical protein